MKKIYIDSSDVLHIYSNYPRPLLSICYDNKTVECL